MKKYEFTEETLTYKGHILHCIKALIDFGDVKAGDLGGWVEKEENLSHEGNCWVANEAKVFGDAKVYGNALVYHNAMVSGNAKVYGNAFVYHNAIVRDYAEVYDNANVSDNALVCGHAWVYHFACVGGCAKVYDNARVYGNAFVYHDAIVCDHAEVKSHALITGNAIVKEMADYIVFQNIWSSGRFFTWTRSNNMWRVGCFYGTGDELIEKAYKDSKESGDKYKIIVEAMEMLNKC